MPDKPIPDNKGFALHRRVIPVTLETDKTLDLGVLK